MSANILFISNKLNLDLGGSNHSLDLMARSLCERGHSVRVKTMNVRRENRYPDTVPYAVEPIRETRGVQSIPRATKHVYDSLTETETWADIIHCFFTPAVPVCGLYRLRNGTTPVVGRLNNYIMFCTNSSEMSGECYLDCTTADKFAHDDTTQRGKLTSVPTYIARTHAVPRLTSQNDKLFAISPQVKDIHVENGVDPETIEVVPNFVDPTYEIGGETESGGGNETDDGDYFDVLYVGRVVREKGVDLLVDSVLDIDDERFRLHVVGDGPLLPVVERTVRDRTSASEVVFYGNVPHDELSEFYTTSALFVHPGRWPEPFGRTVLEALQHHCPVLASNVGAPPWIAGDSGRTFESESKRDLRAKLIELENDREARSEMASRSVEEVQRFGREKTVQRIEAEYLRLIGDV